MKRSFTLMLIAALLGVVATEAQQRAHFDPCIELGLELGMPLEEVLEVIGGDGRRVDRVDTNVDFTGATTYTVVVGGQDENIACSLSVGRLNGLFSVSREDRNLSVEQAETFFNERCAYFAASLGEPTLQYASESVSRCNWGMYPDRAPTGMMSGVLRLMIDDGEATDGRPLYMVGSVVCDFARQSAEYELKKL